MKTKQVNPMFEELYQKFNYTDMDLIQWIFFETKEDLVDFRKKDQNYNRFYGHFEGQLHFPKDPIFEVGKWYLIILYGNDTNQGYYYHSEVYSKEKVEADLKKALAELPE